MGRRGGRCRSTARGGVLTGYVRFLDELGRADLGLAGGKGANLGELVRAGLPVPAGFVLTTDAYRLCVPAPDLSGVDMNDFAALEAASARIREEIEALPLPADLADEVTEAYQRLGSPPVAARSSATAEDLPGASFAGQQESFLDVEGEEALLAAVPRCWASLWTARAIRYRAERGFAGGDVALAVVAQAMAPAEVAGVIFTVNPISGRRDELLVNAILGVGEALVSGTVTPDQWIARRPDGAVLSFTPGQRQRLSPFLARVPPAACLSSGQVRELAGLALRVEAHFDGEPQDIEWSYSEGSFHLLQARPVTAIGGRWESTYARS